MMYQYCIMQCHNLQTICKAKMQQYLSDGDMHFHNATNTDCRSNTDQLLKFTKKISAVGCYCDDKKKSLTYLKARNKAITNARATSHQPLYDFNRLKHDIFARYNNNIGQLCTRLYQISAQNIQLHFCLAYQATSKSAICCLTSESLSH